MEENVVVVLLLSKDSEVAYCRIDTTTQSSDVSNHGAYMNRLKWDKDFALEQAADDADLLQELLTIFKQSCTSDYRIITQGLVSKDAEMICAAAHSIKGAAASLGVTAIRDIAVDIENDSRKGSIAAAQNRIEELSECLQLLQQL